MSRTKQFPSLMIFVALGLLGILLLTACSTVNPEPTADPDPQPVNLFNPVVSATGEVVPLQFATLSMKQGGNLASLLVAEGDQIAAGELIAVRDQLVSRETFAPRPPLQGS